LYLVIGEQILQIWWVFDFSTGSTSQEYNVLTTFPVPVISPLHCALKKDYLLVSNLYLVISKQILQIWWVFDFSTGSASWEYDLLISFPAPFSMKGAGKEISKSYSQAHDVELVERSNKHSTNLEYLLTNHFWVPRDSPF